MNTESLILIIFAIVLVALLAFFLLLAVVRRSLRIDEAIELLQSIDNKLGSNKPPTP
jgi:hypothetical protein